MHNKSNVSEKLLEDQNCYECSSEGLYECELCKKINCGKGKECCISFPHYNDTEMIVCKSCYNKISNNLKPIRMKSRIPTYTKNKITDYTKPIKKKYDN